MHALYVLVLLDATKHEFLRLVLLTAPSISAFVVGYLTPKWKLIAVGIFAFLGAFIGTVSMYIYDLFGLVVDFMGSPLETFAVFLLYYGFMSALGGLLGLWVSRYFIGESKKLL